MFVELSIRTDDIMVKNMLINVQQIMYIEPSEGGKETLIHLSDLTVLTSPNNYGIIREMTLECL